MEFVVNIITLNVPVAAKDINRDMVDSIRRNVIRLYEEERNYYQYGALYNDTVDILDIKPGIKEGGILNDEMVFEVTIRGLFRLYLTDLSYYGHVTSVTTGHYMSDITPCYKVIVPKKNETDEVIKGELFKFTVKDMTSLFSQGKQIVIVGEEVSRGFEADTTYVVLPAYLTNTPHVETEDDNKPLNSTYAVRSNDKDYCLTFNRDNLKRGDVFISERPINFQYKAFADMYTSNGMYVYVFYFGSLASFSDNMNE